MRLALVLLFALVCAAPAFAQDVPDWWASHVDFVSRDGGTWRTANQAADDNPETPDAFGMEWQAHDGGMRLTGRLYGLRGGEEIAQYWTYVEFWHPGENRVVIEQWHPAGLYGTGETTSLGGNRFQVEQTFWLPDGRSWREGHRNIEDGDVYDTETFDIDEEGNWLPGTPYLWTRVTSDAG